MARTGCPPSIAHACHARRSRLAILHIWVACSGHQHSAARHEFLTALLSLLPPRANKGIGLEIVRLLCRDHADKFDVVILAARNPELGAQAVDKLKEDPSLKRMCAFSTWSCPTLAICRAALPIKCSSDLGPLIRDLFKSTEVISKAR